MAKVKLRHSMSDDPIDVEWQRVESDDGDLLRVQIGDESVDVRVEHGAEGAGSLRLDGRVAAYFYHRDNDAVHVWIDGRTYAFELADGSVRRAGGAAAIAALTDLTAPMPGTILDIKVEAGESFEAHQSLVIMESMKMEMTLSASAAGRVQEIVCRVGELVEMGAMLLKLEEGDADADVA